MTDKPELKPCPFCGRWPAILEAIKDTLPERVYHARGQAPAGHRSCALDGWTGTAEDWNRRAPRFTPEEREALLIVERVYLENSQTAEAFQRQAATIKKMLDEK